MLFSVTGRLGMTLATRIVAVCFHVKPKTGLVVETRIDAEKVKWTLRQVGTLELLSDWLNFVCEDIF